MKVATDVAATTVVSIAGSSPGFATNDANDSRTESRDVCGNCLTSGILLLAAAGSATAVLIGDVAVVIGTSTVDSTNATGAGPATVARETGALTGGATKTD